MMRLKMLTAAAALTVATTSAMLAAEGDHSAAAKHGGQYIEVEGHHGIEMVAGADALVFHLTDDHRPMDLAGAQFKALVQTDAGTSTLALTIEGSALRASLKSALPAGAKIVLTGKDRHGHAVQGRFVSR